ncbi:hypothetical protein A2572_01670 [Candidatus Collierbacteria bacterium RIFOXYD1_FULL_40_9]|uniref:DUF4446 domain-containing protein n=1 Tax=Candidatus Collierbacteria bacterium RIFOXYD1_FULL_40_9 TaxID=1817731 RepID=A0A1F5FP67_9BACT|nr:MAG: hypothetical protein A2572_01670 [Candidatus Collierbacteria bacterium RIFOXYD1_FULL_40_9]
MSLSDILSIVSLLGVLIIGIFIYRLSTHYSRLTKDVSKKDLLSSLNQLISLSNENADTINKLSERLNAEIGENKKHLQKIGFNRYNPFTDTGGDQSFTVALLDEKGTGIVISSLHSRENTRLYAKKVVSGQVEGQATSKEEQQVIKEALK